jgi:hypothetical protein
MPPDTAAWGEAHLASDSSYRAIGTQLYELMHSAYAGELVGLPAPEGFTPVDLALLLGLSIQADLTVDAAVSRLATHPAWKYALHLPLDHPGCGGDAFCRFLTRVDRYPGRYRVPIGFITEMVRMAFSPLP